MNPIKTAYYFTSLDDIEIRNPNTGECEHPILLVLFDNQERELIAYSVLYADADLVSDITRLKEEITRRIKEHGLPAHPPSPITHYLGSPE